MSYDGNWFKGSRVLLQECIDNGTTWDFLIMDIILHRVRYNGNNKDLALGECFIGLRELGRLVGKDDKTVKRSLKRLESKSLIRAEPQPHLGTKISVLLHSMFSNGSPTGTALESNLGRFNLEQNKTHIEHISQGLGKKPTPREPPTSPETARVLNEFNEMVGSRYAASGHSGKLIMNLLKKGHTPEELLSVARAKHAQWGEDPKMRNYLKPDTLFGPKNFEKYLDEVKAHVPVEEKYAELLGAL